MMKKNLNRSIPSQAKAYIRYKFIKELSEASLYSATFMTFQYSDNTNLFISSKQGYKRNTIFNEKILENFDIRF